MSKIYLGTVKEGFKDLGGEKLYLYKHTCDCSWYWGFGYIGNDNLHTHFDRTFLGCHSYHPNYDIAEVFSSTHLNQSNWWTILEMFSSAYKLREAADLYNRGGSHISNNLCKAKLQDKELSDRINKDLKLVLDRAWEYIEEAIGDSIQKETANDA